MTVDEAKTKWCPFARVVVDAEHYSNGNRFTCPTPMAEESRCIASECMAWQWDITPIVAAEINARGNAQAKAGGHCGLASK